MTMEKGFSPVGLRVLVVDDDPTWLKILEKMLKKCSYEVTTCGLAREALKLLRERKDGYDIVISDVNMPDMDGFKLLEHVGLEMDLPVIMMSVDGETSRVMKGVQHGACDYLLKPIRMKELKIIWQHVLRKKLQEFRDVEGYEGSDSIWISKHGLDQCEDAHYLGVEEVSFGRKRKDMEKKHHEERDPSDPSSTKKARVVWTFELHQKFVNAVNQIGCDHKAGPKKILDLMNVPWLTRENVASHLQKYRLYLSRLEKEKERKSTCGGVKTMDSPPKDAAVTSGHQSPRNSSYTFHGGSPVLQTPNLNATDIDRKGNTSTPVSESKISDILSPHKAKKTHIGYDHSLAPFASEASSSVFDSLVTPQYSWNDVPQALESKPGSFGGSSLLPQPLPSQSCYAENPAPSCLLETEIKPLFESPVSSCLSRVAPVSGDDFVLTRGKSCTTGLHDLSAPSAMSSMKLQEFDSSIPCTAESIMRNLNREPPRSHVSASMDSDLDLFWLQGDCFGLQNIEFTDYTYPSLLAEYPLLYDVTRFGNELLPEPDEHSLVDQGLFIA